MTLDLARPIIGIENRTAQEVFDIMCDRFRAAERALAERAGGVKVDRRVLNMAISKWAMDSDIDITLGDAVALHEAIMSCLTTEPAAPEGRQDLANSGGRK